MQTHTDENTTLLQCNYQHLDHTAELKSQANIYLHIQVGYPGDPISKPHPRPQSGIKS